jgi:hypothetical protein
VSPAFDDAARFVVDRLSVDGCGLSSASAFSAARDSRAMMSPALLVSGSIRPRLRQPTNGAARASASARSSSRSFLRGKAYSREKMRLRASSHVASTVLAGSRLFKFAATNLLGDFGS